MDERVEHILKEAEEAVSDAEFNCEAARFHVVANRAYYAVFYCVQALLQSQGVFAKTHQGAHQKFHELFMKTDLLPSELGNSLADLAELRNTSDYDYGTAITPSQAKSAVEDARSFLQATQDFFR